MIQGSADRATEQLFRSGACSAQWRAIEKVALRKLDMLDASVLLNDFRMPPGNRLEALKGNRKGQYSIRINRQWRLCFCWSAEGSFAVEIIDYH